MPQRGRLSEWNDDRGYGFITPVDGGERVFVHISAFADRSRRPTAASQVRYELGRDRRGRVCATGVTHLGGASPRRRRAGWRPLPCAVVFVLLAAVGVIAVRGNVLATVLLWYALASGLTFLVYAFDKSAATRQAWRTSESALHLLALFGGWPGAFAAQQLLRHKSRKPSFQVVFWITAILNVVALAWVCMPGGVAAVADLLRRI